MPIISPRKFKVGEDLKRLNATMQQLSQRTGESGIREFHGIVVSGSEVFFISRLAKLGNMVLETLNARLEKVASPTPIRKHRAA